VVAGGSICTVFPEFASQFFDALCAGGVDSVPAVVADFLNGPLKPIYRSPIAAISSYALDYSLFTKSRISPVAHQIEATGDAASISTFGHMRLMISPRRQPVGAIALVITTAVAS
jgi:hypothetical protein